MFFIYQLKKIMICCGKQPTSFLSGGVKDDFVQHYFNIIHELGITEENSKVCFDNLIKMFELSLQQKNVKNLKNETINQEIELINKKIRKLEAAEYKVKGGVVKKSRFKNLLKFLKKNKGQLLTDSKINFIKSKCKPKKLIQKKKTVDKVT